LLATLAERVKIDLSHPRMNDAPKSFYLSQTPQYWTRPMGKFLDKVNALENNNTDAFDDRRSDSLLQNYKQAY